MVIVDKKTCPKRVDPDLFDRWIKNAKGVADCLGFPKLAKKIEEYFSEKDLNVFFSDEVIREDRGYLSYVEARKYIRDCYKTNGIIKKILNNIYNDSDFEAYIDNLYDELVLVNEDIDDPSTIYDTLQFVKGIMKKESYVYSQKDLFDKIIIYPTKYYTYTGDIITFCEIGFVKELFNLAYRNMAKENNDLINNDGFERNDYISKVVKESLSTYFIKCYFNTYGLGCHFLKDLHYRVPYLEPASAYVYINGHNHFIDIFEKSLLSMDVALRMLLGFSNELLYSVINHDFYRNFVLKHDKRTDFSTITPYDFMIDFNDYLLESKSEGTVKSYISWVSSAFETYLGMNIRILSVLNYESRIQVVDKVLSLITGKDDLSNNMRSALHALKTFITIKNASWEGIDITK